MSRPSASTPFWRIALMLTAHLFGWGLLFAIPMCLLVAAVITPIGGLTASLLAGVVGILFALPAIVCGNITFYRWYERQVQ